MKRWIAGGTVLLGLSILGLVPLHWYSPKTPVVVSPEVSLTPGGLGMPALMAIVFLLLASMGTFILHSPSVYSWRKFGDWGFYGLVGEFTWFFAGLGSGLMVSTWISGVAGVHYMYGYFASILLLQGVFIGAPIWLIGTRHSDQFGRWIFGELPVLYGIGRGILEYLRVVPWILGAMVANAYLLKVLGYGNQLADNVQLFFRAESTWQIVILVGMVVVLAPVGEELFFRGLVYRNLREWIDPVGAGWVSAIVFGSVHFDLTTFLPLAVIGYVLARSYERTGSLLVVITMHLVHNGIQLALLAVVLS